MGSYEIKRTDEEIDEQIDLAVKTQGKLFGMSYEEGVRNAIEWILGEIDDIPMEKE